MPYFQVRFTRCEESGRFELLFPVRYPLYDQIIGLKRVSYDPELKTICEENLPTAKELNKAGGLPGVCQLMPFMYGTGLATNSILFCFFFVKNIIDLPGGQINDPSLGKHYSLQFLPATP